MATITFTNNLGTIAFERAMLSITDRWTWSGGAARRQKVVGVTGVILRQDDAQNTEGFHDVESLKGTRGTKGELTLPWTTLSGMRLDSIDMPGNIWIGATPVNAEFTDPFPDKNEYTVDFFGLDLLHPRVSVTLPSRPLREEFVPMPMNGGPVIDHRDVAYNPIRTRMTHDNTQMMLSGHLKVPATFDLDDIIARASRRGGVGNVHTGQMPSGYPHVFDMSEVSDQLSRDLPLMQLWVTRSQLVWDVAQDQMEITLQMECPPQRWS